MKKIILTALLSTLINPLWSESKLIKTIFSDSKISPSPAVLCAATTGEVYVGAGSWKNKNGSVPARVSLYKLKL